MTQPTEPTILPVTASDAAAMSADPVAGNIAALRSLFPDAFAEGRIDFDVLRQLLGDAVDDGDERYGLNWNGKRASRCLALTPSLGTLLPAPADSIEWDTTRNLMIEGDNLEVLKLLGKSYAGKVKLIYIDPPYNTGNDFVYPDDFKDSIGNYLRRTGQVDGEGMKNSSNAESSGRFHSNWLNMIYPRLMAGLRLLREDGAIFVSCDETEQANLRMAMDSIFGSENFVADMVWAAGRKNDSRLVSISHEYIVCFARNSEVLREKKVEWRQRKKGLDGIYDQYARLKRQHDDDVVSIGIDLRKWYGALADGDPSKAHSHYRQVDKRGVYFAADISWPGGGGPKYEVLHPTTKKAVKMPARGWMTGDQARMAEWISDDRVHFGADENSVPCSKSYLVDREYQTPYSVFYQDGRAASKRLRTLMGDDVFDFPKDETVLAEIVEMASSADDIVLDFFAGSGTTGHAVMAQNAADGGNRRYILVQLPEPLDPANKDQKTAADFCDSIGKPRTIAELTKERLRRAAAKVKAEHPDTKADLGFRAYKLASSNIRAWNPGADLATDLLNATDNMLSGRSEADLLVELLLKNGIDLTEPAVTRTLAGKTVNAFGNGALVVCLADIAESEAEALGDALADWIAELAPVTQSKFWFKDKGFGSNQAKLNLAAILEQRLGTKNIELRSL